MKTPRSVHDIIMNVFPIDIKITALFTYSVPIVFFEKYLVDLLHYSHYSCTKTIVEVKLSFIFYYDLQARI